VLKLSSVIWEKERIKNPHHLKRGTKLRYLR
jgi:nucleoid-associated protein YgaU